MRKKIWGAVQLFGAAIFAVIVALASVSPEEATSRLAKWLHFFGIDQIPAALASPDVDIWIRSIAILGFVVSLVFWGHQRWFKEKRMLPLIAFIVSGCAFALCGVWLWTSLQPHKAHTALEPLPTAAPQVNGPLTSAQQPRSETARHQPQSSPNPKTKRHIAEGPISPGRPSTTPRPAEITPEKPSLSVANSPGSIIAPSGGINTIIDQATPKVFSVGAGETFTVPAVSCVVNVKDGKPGLVTTVNLPPNPFMGETVVVNDMRTTYDPKGFVQPIMILGNGHKVMSIDFTQILSAGGSQTMTFEGERWSASGNM